VYGTGGGTGDAPPFIVMELVEGDDVAASPVSSRDVAAGRTT
jgi:hypothetical protein